MAARILAGTFASLVGVAGLRDATIAVGVVRPGRSARLS